MKNETKNAKNEAAAAAETKNETKNETKKGNETMYQQTKIDETFSGSVHCPGCGAYDSIGPDSDSFCFPESCDFGHAAQVIMCREDANERRLFLDCDECGCRFEVHKTTRGRLIGQALDETSCDLIINEVRAEFDDDAKTREEAERETREFDQNIHELFNAAADVSKVIDDMQMEDICDESHAGGHLEKAFNTLLDEAFQLIDERNELSCVVASIIEARGPQSYVERSALRDEAGYIESKFHEWRKRQVGTDVPKPGTPVDAYSTHEVTLTIKAIPQDCSVEHHAARDAAQAVKDFARLLEEQHVDEWMKDVDVMIRIDRIDHKRLGWTWDKESFKNA